VFIHKVDGLSDDHKMGKMTLMLQSCHSYVLAYFAEVQRDIHQRATEDLADAGYENLHLSFYLTSIYDHSIFEVLLVIYIFILSILRDEGCLCRHSARLYRNLSHSYQLLRIC
jgi:hypothetical protein